MSRLEERAAKIAKGLPSPQAEFFRSLLEAVPWEAAPAPLGLRQEQINYIAQLARELKTQCEAEDRAEREATAEKVPMTKAKLLDTAREAVADRGLNYGRPEDNFRRIAHLWNAHLDNRKPGELSSSDVAAMMVLMKVARLENAPEHMDSWIDIAGYAACGGEIAGAI